MKELLKILNADRDMHLERMRAKEYMPTVDFIDTKHEITAAALKDVINIIYKLHPELDSEE